MAASIKLSAKRKNYKCTVEELNTILTFPSGGLMMMPSRSMDNVYDGIFIGDEYAATNMSQLKTNKITHVLNTAKGNKDRFHCNTDPKIYQKANIKYLPIEATDQMNFQLKPYFEKASDFIHDAINNGGSVLVHCREGFSRSATFVLAYLMIKQKMTAQDATRHVRKYREIGPNEGFLQQLCDLNEELWTKGHFEGQST